MARPGTTLTAAVLVLAGLTAPAVGLGTERIGNAPLGPWDYRHWPGIMPIVNHESRVYQRWVNGDERFYYRSDTKTLNSVLEDLAKVEAADRVVILRPGPATTTTLGGEQTMPYDWGLYLLGGIAGHALADSDVFDQHPAITVFIGGGAIELEAIVIPRGLTLLGPADLHARYLRELQSDNRHARGLAAFELAGLNFNHEEDVPAIARLLTDKDGWVRLMAAGALKRLGGQAAAALPALREGLNDSDEAVRTRFAETIAAIEQAKPDPAAAVRQRQETVASINQFVEKKKANGQKEESR